MSSSYSCNICCRNSYQSSRLTPDQYFASFDDIVQFAARQKDRDCYGNIFPEYAVTYPTWSSSNASVADFYGANGVAYALDVGDVQITATWEAEYFLDSGSDTCDAYPVIAAPTGEMTVAPKITSIAPARGGVGSVTRVTINGVGFLDAPIVNAGSGIVISIVSFSRTQIVADFTIAANATGGDRNVTVSGYQITSNAVNFFVQIPTSLSVLRVSVIPTPPNNDPDISTCYPGNDYGISVAVRYRINDQNNPSSPISNTVMIPQETVTDVYVNGIRRPDIYPQFREFSTPTQAPEQFIDVPLGFCANQPFASATYVQNIRLLIENTQTSYQVRTNNFVFTSTASGQGSITNGSDIQASRP